MSLLGRVLGCVVGLGLIGGMAKADTTVSFLANVSVGQAAQPITVLMTMTRSGVAVAPSVVTQGVARADFGMTMGGTCAPGVTYNAGDQCTVVVTFGPRYPGLRSGAVMVLATDGSLLARRLLAGNGSGGLETLVPGRIDTVAGDGAWIYTGDGVAATSAPIFLPMGIVADAGGNLWIADSNNSRIRRVDGQTGTIATVVGTGTPGFAGDGGPATQAEISGPAGMVLDGAGDLYFVDSGNHAIRRVDAVSGLITTVAGTLGSQGYTGDMGPATAARLSLPEGLALDTEQNLYIGDTGNNAVRVVSLATGVIRTKAGTGVSGYNGDNRSASGAQLNAPWGLAVGIDKALYVAESGGHRVRKITLSGTITTVAGTGVKSFGGDGAAALSAGLDTPVALAFDPAGDMYVADSGNNRVRKVSGASANIVTVAGNYSEQFAGDAGPANQASLYGPYALFLDQGGNLLIADMFHNRVRKISANALSLVYPTMRVGKVSQPQLVNLENDGNSAMTPIAPVLSSTELDPATTTCAAGTSIAVDLTCTLGIEFAPTVVGAVVGGSVTQSTDAGNSPAVISVYGEVLSVDPTALSLTSNANPSLVGGAVTFTATVTGSGSGWTGAVTFTDGAAQLCVSNLVPGGTATCTVSTLALGTHTIGASYAGDTYDAASTAPALTQIVKQAPALVLTAAPNPAVVTNNVTLTLQASAAGPIPTGTVVFYDGATAMGSAVLSGSGGATYSTMQLTPGTHALSVQYAGDAADAAGHSNSVNEVVQQAPTITAVASSNATVAVGTSVTLTATVTCQGGPAPTGTVQFTSGTTALGSGSVGANGTATLVLSSLVPGVQNIVAAYSGDTDDAGSTSTPLVETVQQIGTAVALVSDANPVNALATLHLTAMVTMAAGAVADGAITGEVTFKDGAGAGAAVLGRIPVDVNGVATVQLSTLTAGQHGIVASYVGNVNYAGSTSPGLNETVVLAATTTTIAGPSTALAGTPVAMASTVAGANGTTTGSVTFFDGGVQIGVGRLNVGGGATLSTSTLLVGSHSLLATYGGDSNFSGSSSSSLTVVIQQDPTTTGVSVGPSPAAVGQPVTMTATVIAVTQGFTGSVSFVEGGTTLGTGTISSAGVATFTTTGLALGSHPITAVYSGDVNHVGSTSPSTNELIVQVVQMLVAASANPATSGTNVEFSAKVAGGTGGAVVPSGTVTFLDGATVMGTGMLDALGVGSFAISTLAVGTHTITANYGGDSHYGSGTAQMTETIQSASTQITLMASANPATFGVGLGLTATVTSTGGPATGSVTFTEGGATVGSGVIDASGVARMSTSTLAPGPHSIIANYGGDGKASASVSAPLAISVLEVTGVVVAANANPAQTLAAVVLTATVTNAGVGTPSGAVTFTDGGVALGNATVDASGHAALTIAQMSTGNHSIAASYAGDGADFPAVSAAYNEAVVLRPTVTGVSATQTNANNPLQVTLIAAVRWTGPVAPMGTVTFTTTSGLIGTNAVNSTGVASLTIVLATMTEPVVATYNGDASYAPSASLATTVSGGPATQFTLTVTPPNMSVVTKQHAVVQVTATSIAGFTDKLQLGCLGLPYAATCTFDVTASTLAANGTMVATLTIDTGDPLGAGAQARNRGGSGLVMCFIPGGMLAGLAMWRLRRRAGWKQGFGLLMAVLAVALTMGLSGCSGLQQTSVVPGTYTFKVTASGTGTGATVFQPVTLTVTQ